MLIQTGNHGNVGSEILYTFPKTNSSHLKMMVSNRNLLFQGFMFRCYVSFREGNLFIGSSFSTIDRVLKTIPGASGISSIIPSTVLQQENYRDMFTCKKNM